MRNALLNITTSDPGPVVVGRKKEESWEKMTLCTCVYACSFRLLGKERERVERKIKSQKNSGTIVVETRDP